MSFTISNESMLAGVIETLSKQAEAKDTLLEGYKLGLFEFIDDKSNYDTTELKKIKSFIETKLLNLNLGHDRDEIDKLVRILNVAKDSFSASKELYYYKSGFNLDKCTDPAKRQALKTFLDSVRYYNDD